MERIDMAKRFTDTDKYKKPFLRGLQGAYKLLWDYLYHDCDYCGIWIVDFEVAQIYLGRDMIVNKEDALRFFNQDKDRILEIDGGKKWFLLDFIQFQYGQLSETNRAHTRIIPLLKSLNLLNDNMDVVSPLQGAMDIYKEKEKGKEKEKDPQPKKIPFSIIPETWDVEEFTQLWKDYVLLRAKKKKLLTDTAIKQRINELVRIAEDDWGKAKESMIATISGCWDKFYEQENKSKPKETKGNEPRDRA